MSSHKSIEKLLEQMSKAIQIFKAVLPATTQILSVHVTQPTYLRPDPKAAFLSTAEKDSTRPTPDFRNLNTMAQGSYGYPPFKANENARTQGLTQRT